MSGWRMGFGIELLASGTTTTCFLATNTRMNAKVFGQKLKQ